MAFNPSAIFPPDPLDVAMQEQETKNLEEIINLRTIVERKLQEIDNLSSNLSVDTIKNVTMETKGDTSTLEKSGANTRIIVNPFGDEIVTVSDYSVWVDLIEVMGNDATVVNAARVSLGAAIDESQPLRTQDVRLISFLSNNHHITPFFHPMVRLRLTMPIFVAREWFRHTIGFARNEVSRRYVDSPVVCFIPDGLRERHPSKKQGSKDTIIPDHVLTQNALVETTKKSIETYRFLLKQKVAPEIARTVLPQSMMTQFIETASLAAYARLYALRYSPDAQYEIQKYAEVVGKLLEEKFPVSWKALTSKKV